MEELLIAFVIMAAITVPLAVFVGLCVLAAIAFFASRKNRDRINRQDMILETITRRLDRLEASPVKEERLAPPEAEREEEAVRVPSMEPEPEPPVETAAPDIEYDHGLEAPTSPPASPGPAPGQPAPVAAARTGDREKWQKFEERIGKRWMIWAGMVVLFLAAGFFVKYAIDNYWLGPTARVVLGIITGIALLVLGDRFARRKKRALGQGLMGGGLAILYVSLFAAFSLYGLVPQAIAFLSMIIITAAGMTLALLHDAIAVSILALLGGLLTPVMVSTGQDVRDTLFGYLTLLDLGVLGVMFFKRWRALDTLAFIGTMAIFTGWFMIFYSDASMIPALLWLGGFFIIFLLAPFAYHLRRRSRMNVDRFILALANAAAAFTFAYVILRDDYTHVLGFIALGMSACYLATGAVTRMRIAGDARSLFAFVALSVVFCTLAVPLHLKLHGITLAWAAEGPVLLYLGYRFRYMPVRVGGMVVLLFAVVRLFAYHWPPHLDPFVPLLNHRFAGAMFVPAAASSFAIIHHWWRQMSSAADRVFKHAGALSAGFLALVILHEEFREWLVYDELGYHSWAAIIGIWAAGSACFLGAGIRLRSPASRAAGLPVLLIALALAFSSYFDDNPGDYYLVLNAHFAAALFAVGMLFAYGFILHRFSAFCVPGEQTLAKFLFGAGLLCLLVLLSTETYAYIYDAVADRQKAGWMARMSLSIVWGIYAAALLGAGFRKRVRILRFTALALFLITALKLVLVDMASVRHIYRIISFLSLGVLMTGASYFYHRVEKSIGQLQGGKK